MKKKSDTISAADLATYSNLTTRRLYQLATEHRISAPIRGAFPMPATIQRLFAYYQQNAQSFAKERLLKITAERKLVERENRIAQALEDETYMLTQDGFKIMRMVMNALENLPGRAASEHGLTPAQTAGIQRLIDEARTLSAIQIEAEANQPTETQNEKEDTTIETARLHPAE